MQNSLSKTLIFSCKKNNRSWWEKVEQGPPKYEKCMFWMIIIKKMKWCLAFHSCTVSYLREATSGFPALSTELVLLRYLWNECVNVFLMVLCFLFRNCEQRSRANTLIPYLPFVWISVLKLFRQNLSITHLRSIKAWQDFQQVRMVKSR